MDSTTPFEASSPRNYEEIDPDGDLIITLFPSSDPLTWGDPEWSEDRFYHDNIYYYNVPTAAGLDLITIDCNENEQQELIDTEPDPLAIKVCSKHMFNASPRFKRMLHGPWLEATTWHTHETGERNHHVEIDGFCQDAFLTVMNIIHGNNWKVPKSVDLELLGQVALIVDDLGCAEAVAPFVEIWTTRMMSWWKMPEVVNRELVLWIFISFTFRLGDHFHKATTTATLKSKGPLPSLGLPIPEAVLHTIEIDRRGWIGSLLQIPLDLLKGLNQTDSWVGSGVYCGDKACQTELLDQWTKTWEALSLIEFDVKVNDTLTGLSFAETLAKLKEGNDRLIGCKSTLHIPLPPYAQTDKHDRTPETCSSVICNNWRMLRDNDINLLHHEALSSSGLRFGKRKVEGTFGQRDPSRGTTTGSGFGGWCLWPCSRLACIAI
ncbi:hypothetical protein GE09DRAFT_1155013 [Coniochaeta sp. 2T2.1]|nr:hypothetical protein GE09DRAFT_1155013 [Coniochaeta sp. 2T2.1]